MAGSGVSRANANREIRREELRKKLAAGGHVEHVIEISTKLADLSIPLEPNDVTRLKAAADIKKGLITKYLPDLKAIEHTGEDGSPIEIDHNIVVEFIEPTSD